MARTEHDREDLFAEATALVERVEAAPAEGAEPHVIGTRRDGSLSLYCGGDPVFHFSAAGELRRAFVAGRLLKADGGRLIAMQRVRTAAETQLVSNALDDAKQRALLEEAARRIASLHTAAAERTLVILRQAPQELDAIAWLAARLASLPTPLRVADHL